MARRDFLPINDEPLMLFTQNFGRRIGESPEAYDLTPETAAAYKDLTSLYRSRLQAAVDPETRGRRTVFLKQETKNALVAETRRLAKQINNLMKVDDDQRQALGLTIRDTTRSAKSRPKAPPVVKVAGTDGRTVTVDLLRADARRGRPAQVDGATVFTHLGPTPPATIEGWRYAAQVTKSRVELPFGPSEAGDTAWVVAFWTNTAGTGPASRPVSVNLPAGGVLPKEAGEAGEEKTGKAMKIAA